MTLEAALKIVAAAGYRISKPRPKKQTRVGPTCVVRFADGATTRMTTHCPGDVLDWRRGEHLARHAWASRHRAALESAPPIKAMHFERDGEMIGEPLRNADW